MAPTSDVKMKLRAAVYVKNHVMRFWVPDEGEPDNISAEDRALIKSSIINLYMNAPDLVDAQFEHALGIISQADFPAQWPDLLQTIVAHVGSSPDSNKRAFQVLNTLTYHFRVRGQTAELIDELVKVHKELLVPTRTTLVSSTALIDSASTDPAALTTVLQTVHYCIEVFYSLCFQELPSEVEDDMDTWFTPIASIMTKPAVSHTAVDALPNSLLKKSLKGSIDNAQTSVCSVARLFAGKYEEAFAPYIETFVGQVWQLLTHVSADEEYDALVASAISFLSSMCRKEWYKGLFENNLTPLCENVAIPQLQLREADEELFDTNWQDYVSQDMLGADAETRRRTAADLVNALCVHFAPQVSEILKKYIAFLLGEAAKSPDNWKAKDVAMYIAVALSVRTKTRAKGAVEINPYVDIGDFFGSVVMPELQSSDLSATPIIKADCLKFLVQFRSHLPTDALPSLLQTCAKWLAAESPVVHTYAAIAIEKLISVKDSEGAHRLPITAIKDQIPALLTALFAVFANRESAENEHVMLAILRLVSLGKDIMFPYAEAIIAEVIKRLTVVVANPRQPRFNHNLFEVLACVINALCTANPALVESFLQQLLPQFEIVLGSEECSDLQPYTFQILAQLLELSPSVPAAYAGIFSQLLLAVLWDNQANCPAISRLLAAYLNKGYAPRVEPAHVTALLGIFQKLNAHSRLDSFGFVLIKAMYCNFPLATLAPFLVEVLRIQFSRLSSKKTPQYQAGLVGFWSAFVTVHGAEPLLQAMNTLQAGMTGMVLEKVWLPSLSVVGGKEEKAIAVRGTAGLIKFLLSSKQYAHLLPGFFAALVNLAASAGTALSLEAAAAGAARANSGSASLAAEVAAAAADDDMLDQASASFKGSFARLVFALPAASPLLKDYTPKATVAALSAEFPAEVQALAAALPAPAQAALQAVMA